MTVKVVTTRSGLSRLCAAASGPVPNKVKVDSTARTPPKSHPRRLDLRRAPLRLPLHSALSERIKSPPVANDLQLQMRLGRSLASCQRHKSKDVGGSQSE